MDPNPTPPKKIQLLFWLILGSLSTFFAEVLSGSDMFPYFHAWGLLVVVPLYSLHILLLGSLVLRADPPRFSSLIFAGMIFGLYEAYLTKVLFAPPWGDPLIVAGFAPIETLVLVFWWHTWFSFIIPLLVAEKLLTGSHSLGRCLPGKLGRFFNSWAGLAGVMAFGGIFQSINSPSVGQSLLSGISCTGILAGLTLLWKRITRDRSYSLKELLPDREQFKWLLIPTILMYLVMGFLIRPEALPGLEGQLVIWILYGAAGFLLIRSLKNPAPPQQKVADEGWPGQRWLLLGGIFPLAAAAGELLISPFSDLLAIVCWLGGIVFGLGAFLKALRLAFPRRHLPDPAEG